jgi:hypothetical protein
MIRGDQQMIGNDETVSPHHSNSYGGSERRERTCHVSNNNQNNQNSNDNSSNYYGSETSHSGDGRNTRSDNRFRTNPPNAAIPISRFPMNYMPKNSAFGCRLELERKIAEPAAFHHDLLETSVTASSLMYHLRSTYFKDVPQTADMY